MLTVVFLFLITCTKKFHCNNNNHNREWLNAVHWRRFEHFSIWYKIMNFITGIYTIHNTHTIIDDFCVCFFSSKFFDWITFSFGSIHKHVLSLSFFLSFSFIYIWLNFKTVHYISCPLNETRWPYAKVCFDCKTRQQLPLHCNFQFFVFFCFFIFLFRIMCKIVLRIYAVLLLLLNYIWAYAYVECCNVVVVIIVSLKHFSSTLAGVILTFSFKFLFCTANFS